MLPWLCSPVSLLTSGGGLLLLVGLVITFWGDPALGRWVYLASAAVTGFYIVTSAVRRALKRDFTADILVSLAMIGAVIIGEYSAAAIVGFMLMLGGFLESYTMARASHALEGLACLIPNTTTLRRDGQEVTVSVDQVQPGDVLLVRTGERIAVDGVVATGSASVNLSCITGESLPATKGPGDEVYAGALNEVGTLEVKATKVGKDTTLARIISLVEQAQQASAPIQRTVDKYAQYLTPLAIFLAGVVFWLTGDPIRAVTVLVVFCPCALVLATPTAVVAAIGNAARGGILIKKGVYLEEVGRARVVAFDKTGTLTLGQPHVEEVVCLNQWPRGEVLALAATAERFSEHPLGKAVVAAAREAGISLGEPQDFQVMPGLGVMARVDSKRVLLGNRSFLSQMGIALAPLVEGRLRQMEEKGKAVIPVVVGEEVAGLLVVADRVRPEAAQVVQSLRRMGIETVLLSGDNPGVTSHIASRMGMSDFRAGLLPEEKLSVIKELQGRKGKVVMVGDGVNDAPALATADVGIAMGVVGTDVAIENANIALMGDDLTRVPYAIGLSQKTLSVIHRNILFSMGVNILAVALGGFGIIGPVVGAVLHELSSLPVIANSARLLIHKVRLPANVPAAPSPATCCQTGAAHKDGVCCVPALDPSPRGLGP